MTKKPQPPKDQIDLFYEIMRDVKPLKHQQARVTIKSKKTTNTQRKPTETQVTLFHPDLDSPIPERVKSDAHLSFKHPSISHKILRNLKKGQYNVEAILDLHGYTVDDAQSALDRFLQECIRKQNRVVLIIHGKSRASDTPVLKNKLNEWLRQIRAVLAFCSAQPVHGSRGALYVLLKRVNEEDLLE